MDSLPLPAGFLGGHWTDAAGATGCTVLLTPPGSTASGEVRGGAPGTRETDLLSPAAAVPGIDAILLTGGSAFGLAAAGGVADALAAEGRGFPTPGGPVPLVVAGVLYDLVLGDPAARPDAAAGVAAVAAAGPELARGSVGAGTGCTVGKALGPDAAVKGGLGVASERVGGVTLTAVAAVNPLGDVLAEDGSVLAGPRGADEQMLRTADILREEGALPVLPLGAREQTTLVAVLTDAALTKTECWVLARAASAGIPRAIDPSGTALDGDLVVAAAGGSAGPGDPFVLSALAPQVVAAAIRDGVRSATALDGCPSISGG